MVSVDSYFEAETDRIHDEIFADDNLELHECPICNAEYTSEWPFWVKAGLENDTWVCCSECVEDFDIRKVEGKKNDI